MHCNMGTRRQMMRLALGGLGLALTSCGSGTQSTPRATLVEGRNVALSGAGATFPATLYKRWFSEFNRLHPNVQVTYQSLGSGAGVRLFTSGSVDFGASDVGMAEDDRAKVKSGALQLPVTGGSIILSYNLPGVNALRLSREAYINILLGKITRWNDPILERDNPNESLPDRPITVVYRSDRSGTTGYFTKHLSTVSKEWRETLGEGGSVKWRTGIGGNGNEGVTAIIKEREGAIGYVEYSYARQNDLSFALLENKSGQFILPSPETAARTLGSLVLPPSLLAFNPDPTDPQSYPVVTFSWLLVNQKYDDADKGMAIKELLTWIVSEGQQFSDQLGYVPLPDNVTSRLQQAIATIT
ncbi:MAG: phosphate ABC transporter substrate-binding protein PstS [Oscillatoriales cyanobacterium SM2_2_1]|nr:phosphate ABC transporter substrate-binding protein PstS [Oscillatoriales cyanobacterium SM2_2_1]